MGKKESELKKLEEIAESLIDLAALPRINPSAYDRQESKIDSEYSRLARINELLRSSLEERNRLAGYLDSILASIDSGVIVTDRDGKIRIFNSAAEKLTGIRAGDVLGKEYREVLGQAASPEADLILSGGNSSVSGEKWLEPDKNKQIPVAFSLSCLRQSGREGVEGMVEIIHDLTINRKLEEDLKRASALAGLGEMAATVAHEIRNPLSGIAGFADLLMRDLDKNDSNLDTVKKIRKGVKALNTIVTNLLDFAKTITPNIMNIEPAAIIEETIDEVRADSEARDHTFEIIKGSRKLRANLDPDLFRQIIYNLARNAVQTNPDGGHVSLDLSESPGSDFILKIEDDGPGIPDSIKDRIFTPFFTTKTNGIGLGLATVKKLVELHGGKITAGNKTDGGAVFTIIIPGDKGDLS
jgi:PAS domain S-box-containing protein